MQIFLSFPIFFCLRTYQLLSVLPAGLIGCVLYSLLLVGCPLPEHMLDRFFSFLTSSKSLPIPKLQGSIIAQLKEREICEQLFSSLCISPCTCHLLQELSVSPCCRIKRGKPPFMAVGARTPWASVEAAAWICRLPLV